MYANLSAQLEPYLKHLIRASRKERIVFRNSFKLLTITIKKSCAENPSTQNYYFEYKHSNSSQSTKDKETIKKYNYHISNSTNLNIPISTTNTKNKNKKSFFFP